ncbi:nucleotidyltransferase family protein [Paenibacillus humicola]|uniref:nucleotidyltransferase family protein n=1 Tax=Paenibacillus humicola TaxID=3110540 RepID=UPI00237ABD78|nr:nucleotidyltransferase family protein [Paenibacillus humicola]
MNITGIYLAAGAGSRLGGNKPSAELAPGVRLGGAGLRTFMAAGFERIVLVVRSGDRLDWLREVTNERTLAPEIAVCADADKGMAQSLKCGIGRAEAAGADAAVVMLADQPFVTAELLRALAESLQADPGIDYAASGHADVVGPPVLLTKSMFAAVRSLEGDQGARRLLKDSNFRGKVIRVSVPEQLMDVDTPEDLRAARLYAAGLK